MAATYQDQAGHADAHPQPRHQPARVVHRVCADGGSGACEQRQRRCRTMMANTTTMITPTTRPARISQPTLRRQRSHALANTSPMVTVSSCFAYVDARAPLHAQTAVNAPDGCPCVRCAPLLPLRQDARLEPQGVPQDRRHGGRRSTRSRPQAAARSRWPTRRRGPPGVPAGSLRQRRRPELAVARGSSAADITAAAVAALGGMEAVRAPRAPTSSSSPTSARGTTARSTRRPPIPTWSGPW